MQTVKLGEIIEVKKGKKPEAVLDSPCDGSRPCLLIDEVRGKRPTNFTTDAKGVEVTKNDICIVWDGANAGTVGFGVEGLIGSTVARLRIISQSQWDTGFVGRLLQGQFQSINTAAHGKGATIPHVDKRHLEAIEFPAYSLEEQKRIAAILDQADDIRRKRQHAIDRLNQLGQAIFHEMFGQMRKAPFQWPSVAFGEIVESAKIGLVRSSQEMGDQFEVPYLRMDAIQRNGQLELGGMKKTHATKNERDEFSLSAGDFLFNTRNSKELVGKSGVVINDIDAVYNNNILRVKFKDVANYIYVHAYFREPYAQQELEIRKSGTTSVFAIYQKNLETMPVPLPPIDMQINFASRVQYIFELSQKFIAAQSFSSGFFASLQHRAFTGQL